MNHNWLVGPSGTAHITRLKSVYERKVIEDTFGKIPARAIEYTPWLQLLRIGQKGTVYSPVASNTSKLVVDRDHLKSVSEIVSGSGGPLSILGVEKLPFQINTDILLQQPDAVKFVDSCLEPIFNECGWLKALYQSLVHQVIPMKLPEEGMRAGFSTVVVRGVIFTSIQPDRSPINQAKTGIDIIHELGHQSLMVYQAADPIFLTDSLDSVYSGIKKTDRPAIMAFHGAVALSYMMIAIQIFEKHFRGQAEVLSMLSGLKWEHWTALKATLADIDDKSALTQLGRKLFYDMEIILNENENTFMECI